MLNILDSQPSAEKLIDYFSSYLSDITLLIMDIKQQVYQIINVSTISQKKAIINNDIPSIMSACKKTFEDLKRIETILKGYIKGKTDD